MRIPANAGQTKPKIMQLTRRNRRLRSNEAVRSLVRQTYITPSDFIVPLFIVEGKA